MPVITLTTDFGCRDWFVGAMKGVILKMAPSAQIVDITHEIPPGQLMAGAFAIASSFDCFPKQTIHVVVVDPGVGSARRAIAVQASGHLFVGPDNGVLTWAAEKSRRSSVHEISNRQYLARTISQTFHGRDVFAPAAAHLSAGLPLRRLGPARDRIVELPFPPVREEPGGTMGEILYIDRFGNGITNLTEACLRRFGGREIRVRAGRPARSLSLKECYQSVKSKSGLAILGSSGYLEIAVNGGDAARQLRLRLGDRVRVCTVRAARPD